MRAAILASVAMVLAACGGDVNVPRTTASEGATAGAGAGGELASGASGTPAAPGDTGAGGGAGAAAGASGSPSTAGESGGGGDAGVSGDPAGAAGEAARGGSAGQGGEETSTGGAQSTGGALTGETGGTGESAGGDAGLAGGVDSAGASGAAPCECSEGPCCDGCHLLGSETTCFDATWSICANPYWFHAGNPNPCHRDESQPYFHLVATLHGITYCSGTSAYCGVVFSVAEETYTCCQAEDACYQWDSANENWAEGNLCWDSALPPHYSGHEQDECSADATTPVSELPRAICMDYSSSTG